MGPKVEQYGPATEVELRKVNWIYISNSEERFNQWRQDPVVHEIEQAIGQLQLLPNACFPETVQSAKSGQRMVRDVELLDVFRGDAWHTHKYMPASVGCMQSHRRAWFLGDEMSPTAWLMVCEDDIKPSANAVDKLLFTMQMVLENEGKHHLIMLAGGDGPMMSEKARTHSNVVYQSFRLVDLRSLPMTSSGGYQVPLHIGLGMKWYLISPLARKLLLQMTWKHASFERAIWSELYNSDWPEIKSKAKSRANRTLFAKEPLGTNARDYNDWFVGSGRNEGDAGHRAAPFMAVVMPGQSTLGERLQGLICGMIMADCASLGLALHWHEHCCEITSDELLDTSDLHAMTQIPFCRVIRDHGGSNFNYYFGNQSLKWCEITSPMRIRDCLDMLRTYGRDMVNEIVSRGEPVWKGIRLQGWIIDKVEQDIPEKFLPKGVTTEASDWPEVFWIGNNAAARLMCQSHEMSKKGSKSKACPLKPKGLWSPQSSETTALKEIQHFLEKNPETKVIILSDSRRFWQKPMEQWNGVLQSPNVLVYGMEKASAKPEWRTKTDKWGPEAEGIISAVSMAIFSKAPTFKKRIMGDSWLAECCLMMEMDSDELKELLLKPTPSPPSSGFDHTPPWRSNNGHHKGPENGWWKLNGPSLEAAFLERDESLTYELKQVLNDLLPEDMAEFNKDLESRIRHAQKLRQSIRRCDIGQFVRMNATFKNNQDEYKRMLYKQQKLPGNQQLWKYLPALLYNKLMRLRHQAGQDLWVMKNELVVPFSAPNDCRTWPEIYKHFVQLEKEDREQRKRGLDSGSASDSNMRPDKIMKLPRCS